jgi:hypothetical protein
MFEQPKEVPENFADDHDAEVNAGLKHGRLLGDLFAVMTDNKLKPVVLPQGKGAILCGYVYGFADVLCQDLGNERDGAASVSALVAALKVVAPLSSKTLIDRF